MSADNLEGPEVDLLIKELSSAKKPAAVPVVSAPPATKSVPAAPPSFFGGTNRLIVPPPPRVQKETFLSGIKLPSLPAMPKISMPSISMPSMPSMNMPSFRMPSVAMPSIGRPSFAMEQTALVARMCVGLGVSLSIAMPFWPYPRTGLWWMLFYLFAIGLVLVSGVWSAKLTWSTRLGYAHILALGIVLWGLTLVTEETMRNGYFSAQAAFF